MATDDIANNGFMKFLAAFQAAYPDLQFSEVARQGAKLWVEMSQSDKAKYYIKKEPGRRVERSAARCPKKKSYKVVPKRANAKAGPRAKSAKNAAAAKSKLLRYASRMTYGKDSLLALKRRKDFEIYLRLLRRKYADLSSEEQLVLAIQNWPKDCYGSSVSCVSNEAEQINFDH